MRQLTMQESCAVGHALSSTTAILEASVCTAKQQTQQQTCLYFRTRWPRDLAPTQALAKVWGHLQISPGHRTGSSLKWVGAKNQIHPVVISHSILDRDGMALQKCKTELHFRHLSQRNKQDCLLGTLMATPDISNTNQARIAEAAAVSWAEMYSITTIMILNIETSTG